MSKQLRGIRFLSLWQLIDTRCTQDRQSSIETDGGGDKAGTITAVCLDFTRMEQARIVQDLHVKQHALQCKNGVERSLWS